MIVLIGLLYILFHPVLSEEHLIFHQICYGSFVSTSWNFPAKITSCVHNILI